MPRPIKPDPYNGFKEDRERRIALNTRVRWYAGAAAVAAVAGAPGLAEKMRWLMHLFL